MSGKVHDENFLKNEKAAEGTADWYRVDAEAFDIYGLLPEDGGLLSRRMPAEAAEKVNPGVRGQSDYGAGGRIRFSTDSPFVALKVIYGDGEIPTVCNHCFTYGFDLYRCDESGQEVFVGAFRPGAGFDRHTAEYKKPTRNGGKMICYTLNLPHFSQIRELHIGIEKGSLLGRGKAYRNEKPVVFYGSSITHGAAAGRPGNTYENFISQAHNVDYVNLGFAGSAKGEAAMAEYIAGLQMCAFVCDYDANAPTAEHLAATHYPFYEIVRKAHPHIPYIMISRPHYFANPEQSDNLRAVIRASYEKALASGDQNVYFIDGETLFAGPHSASCTSDGVHPNDLGFYRMADKIGAVLANVLGFA